MSASYAVPEPVACSRQTHTSRSNRQWEDLSNNDPSRWTPCHGEHGDVDADERDHASDSRRIAMLASSDTNDADYKLRYYHAGTTDKQNPASAESFYHPE